MKEAIIVRSYIIKRNGYYNPDDPVFYCNQCHGKINKNNSVFSECPYCKSFFTDRTVAFFREK